MRNPWIIAQLAVAAVLLVISLIGVIGTLFLDMPELTFSFGGAIQAFAIFPGLVLSLVVNALVMHSHRAVGISTTEKVLLIAEGLLIALLLLFHFYVDEAGNTFGLAILTWPIAIMLAVAIAGVAIFRAVSSRRSAGAGAATPEPVPPPDSPAP